MSLKVVFPLEAPVSFGQKLASSEAFKTLFRDGMSMVEGAAAYLDGEGREESRKLPRIEALAYASESMRLTTRLMQLASWLLLQRAVNEGELTQEQAASEKRKVRLSAQEPTSSPEVFSRLPERLRELVGQSHLLQERVLRLDKMIYETVEPAPVRSAVNPVGLQLDMLRDALQLN
jgi:regulator of CtrA degradation